MIEKKASAKNERKPYAPTEGFLYRNRGGGVFRCVSNALGRTTATMVNVKSGWMFTAYGIGRYSDDSIDWDFSLNGRFVKEATI